MQVSDTAYISVRHAAYESRWCQTDAPDPLVMVQCVGATLFLALQEEKIAGGWTEPI